MKNTGNVPAYRNGAGAGLEIRDRYCRPPGSAVDYTVTLNTTDWFRAGDYCRPGAGRQLGSDPLINRFELVNPPNDLTLRLQVTSVPAFSRIRLRRFSRPGRTSGQRPTANRLSRIKGGGEREREIFDAWASSQKRRYWLLLSDVCCAGTLHAAEASVEYRGRAEQIVFLPEGDDLFLNFKGLMPGDRREQVIQLANRSDQTVSVDLKSAVAVSRRSGVFKLVQSPGCCRGTRLSRMRRPVKPAVWNS